MDDPIATPNNILSGIYSLPPAFQGLAVLGVAIGIGLFLGRKYLKRLVAGQADTSRVFAAGEPTMFADMSSVKNLVVNTEDLTKQLVVNEKALTALTSSFSQLGDIVGQLLIDMRDEREARQDQEREKAAEDRGFQRGLKSPRPRRRTAARKPTA